ncbi:MAG: ATP-binding protein [Terracidiphilus sp.]|jgi:heavy metal sensor kinase
MSSLPIRVRLTLWYFAMFASAAALLSLASLRMLRSIVDATEYHELQERADDVRELLSHEDPTRNLNQLSSDFAAVYSFKDDGKYLQVRDQDGHWIFRSKRMIAENPDLPAPDRIPMAGRIAEFQQGIHHVRLLDYSIAARGKRYSVQTGISLNKSMALLASFRAGLLLLTPLVILLAAVGGHLMSRKALAPVAALAAEARRINDRNLDRRLPVPDARDEISDLSLTLNQMLERIDRAFSSVRTFTGNASHELRTPISLLRTEIEVALFRPRDGEEYRAILSRLHDETVRMTSLVENLLSLARADGGAESFTLAPIRVVVLFDQVMQIWKNAMNQAMLDFCVDLPDGDLALLGDSHGILRLLSILLENASRFTPPGGSVKLCAEAAKDRIVLSVHDTGIGIAPEHRVRIFDRFYRIAPTSETVPAGSGLGLALGKWIAERHGTELCVESTPGRGSCFSFSLERAEASVPAVSVRQKGQVTELELSMPRVT